MVLFTECALHNGGGYLSDVVRQHADKGGADDGGSSHSFNEVASFLLYCGRLLFGGVGYLLRYQNFFAALAK